jgi:alpha-soluble NSF attachment protein
VHILTAEPGKEAGQAFKRAASIQLDQLKEPDEYANTMTEAFSESNIQ